MALHRAPRPRSRDRGPAFLHGPGSEKLRDSGVPSPQIEVEEKLLSNTRGFSPEGIS